MLSTPQMCRSRTLGRPPARSRQKLPVQPQNCKTLRPTTGTAMAQFRSTQPPRQQTDMRDKVVDGLSWSKFAEGTLACCIHNVEDTPGLGLDDTVIDIIPGAFVSQTRCTETACTAHMVFRCFFLACGLYSALSSQALCSSLNATSSLSRMPRIAAGLVGALVCTTAHVTSRQKVAKALAWGLPSFVCR